MASEDLKVIIKVTGADKAEKDVSKVKNAVGTNNSGLTGSIIKANLVIGAMQKALDLAGSALNSFQGFLAQSSQVAKNYEKSMITLDILAERYGVSAEKAKKASEMLGKELRIGVGPAAEGLTNLFKSGLNLDQSIDLMRRFTNEAITGKSANISLSEAVQNLTFAYATNNSALGNMSGVSENFEYLIVKGRDALLAEGMALEDITDDMAKYRGMIDLTNMTKGASEAFNNTLIDSEAQLDQQMQDLYLTVGQQLNPILNELMQNLIIPGAKWLADLADKGFKFLKGALEEAQPFIESIKQSLIEIFAEVSTPENQAALQDIGAMLKEAFKESIVNAIKSIALRTKEFLEYLKSPEGKKAIQDFIGLIRTLAEALRTASNLYSRLTNARSFDVNQLLGQDIYQKISAPKKYTNADFENSGGLQSFGRPIENRTITNNLNIAGTTRASSDNAQLMNAMNILAQQF